jgi:phage terminase large subunit
MLIQFPYCTQFLAERAPYKILYGGRGGGKSQAIATQLLIDGLKNIERVLCAREIQSSLSQSVLKLLEDQIYALDLQSFYEVQRGAIYGKNGTEFLFAGLRHNLASIKSTQGITKCWVEEAQTVSKQSWDVLLPTLRKERIDENGQLIRPELFVSFNPDLDTDETYKRFVLDPPQDAIVRKINYYDNPWFPEGLRRQMEACKAKNYDDYLNIWEGHCKQVIDGAVYANELRELTESNRVCRVPRAPGKPVDTFWDLGKRDHTSIWFAQILQGEYRIIGFYQNRGEELEHYLLELQRRGYMYGTHFLPHDAAHDRLGAVTIEKQIKAAYPGKVKVLDRIHVISAGIEATRAIFPLCWFDEEGCADGLQALRRYKFDVDPATGGYSKTPLHDENSDAADSFRQIAQSLNAHKPKTPIKTIEVSKRGTSTAGGWMGR